MSGQQTERTRALVEKLYTAYLGGDTEGMIALMSDDAVVTFNAHGTFRGLTEIRPYMTWASRQLPRLTFNVRTKIIEGEYAAVTWDETGVTARGEPWEAMGVDIFRVVGDKIVELADYSDTEKILRLLEPYPGRSNS